MVRDQQRSCRASLGAMDRGAVGIYPQRREVERAILDVRPPADGRTDLLVNLAEDPLPNGVGPQSEKTTNDENDNQGANDSCSPTEFSFYRHNCPKWL